ncbi:MAG: Fe-Mn family superoxide dismutase [Actinobacteria bacterium]|nr:Fe-Mn family superoxide dismutase [Actinomycetota bacterium]
MNFQPIEVKTFSSTIFRMQGISKKTVEEHLKLYQGYVKKYNAINVALANLGDDEYAQANQTYSLIRELKVELTFAWGGIVNHEIYFTHLGGKGYMPEGDLLKQIESDFGSFDKYKKDVKATAVAARGWVWTAWNSREKRLFNYLGDAQNTFPVWFTDPIMALDTYEHAYFIDYGVNRANYIDAFFANLDWKIIADNYSRVR